MSDGYAASVAGKAPPVAAQPMAFVVPQGSVESVASMVVAKSMVKAKPMVVAKSEVATSHVSPLVAALLVEVPCLRRPVLGQIFPQSYQSSQVQVLSQVLRQSL